MDYELMNRTNAPFDPEMLRATDTMQQPAYAWTWNAPTDKTEIKRQLDNMLRAGIRTLYVLPEPEPFRDYTKRVHLLPPYLSEEFFDHMRYMTEYATAHGMTVWLYDEGGWPSGMACGQVLAKRPELCRKGLEVRKVALQAGDAYEPGERAFAAFAEGKRISAGTRFARDVELDEYFVKWQGGLNTDCLDDDSGKVFTELTHEKYTKYMGDLFGEKDEQGKRIPGTGKLQLMFTDEPGTGRYAWPRGFEDKFIERYGYDLRDYLPDLLAYQDNTTEAGYRARIDYRALTGELFQKNYLKPIHDWSIRNHVPSSGHLDIDHESIGCYYHHYGTVLQQLREMDIPGIDVIWGQISQPKHGEPPCAEGNGFFPRFASSAAAQTGGRLALTESFAVYSAALSGEQARYVLNFQLVRGINVINHNSISYTSSGASPLLIRPSFVEQMPGYEHLRPMNDYIARASYLMRLGNHGTNTALYYPARDIWAGGDVMRDAVKAFDETGRRLERLHVDFDIIDDYGILEAQRDGDSLTLGLGHYDNIIVPDCKYMPDDVRKKLSGVAHKVIPALKVSSPFIRVRKRVLPDGGSVFMLFNESGRKITAKVAFEGKHVTRIDAQTAVMTVADGMEKITLLSGEAAFFLCSEETPAGAVPATTAVPCGAVGDFSLRKLRETYIDPEGEHDRLVDVPARPCRLGSWGRYFGKAFSGEAVYETTLSMDHKPEAGRKYLIDLGKVDYTADISVDGKKVGAAWVEPKCILVDGEVFGGKQQVKLSIRVANTLANQCNSLPLVDMFPSDEIGPYQDRLRLLEAEAKVGGLAGPVTVSMLRDDENGRNGSNP